MAKVWKLQHSLLLRYSTIFPENMFQLRMWLSCVPRAPVIPTSKFSGVLNTMVKVWKLSHLLSLRYTTAFPQNTFLLRKWLFSSLELWKSPQYQSRDALNTSTQNLANEPTLANGPPSTRAEMPCIPVHTTWQMNLLWLMAPLSTRAKMPWIAVHKKWQMNLL